MDPTFVVDNFERMHTREVDTTDVQEAKFYLVSSTHIPFKQQNIQDFVLRYMKKQSQSNTSSFQSIHAKEATSILKTCASYKTIGSKWIALGGVQTITVHVYEFPIVYIQLLLII